MRSLFQPNLLFNCIRRAVDCRDFSFLSFKNKRFLLSRYRIYFVSLFIVLLSFSDNSFAYSTADSFRYPLNSGGWYLSQDFCVWNSSFGGYHLGEDLVVNDGLELPVYAPANGIVKHNMSRTSYGRVVIIEHRLTDGSYVTSVHGHMRSAGIVSVGTEVSKGDLIGYLSSDYNENGGYAFTHLHFGIREGAYSSTWVYYGYRSSCSGWHDPTDFVNSYSGSEATSVYDFWRKDDPLYADSNSDIWNPNFDAQYKIVNNSNEDIYIDRLALAVHDSDDNYLFDLSDPNTGQARFYDDLVLSPGETHHFVFSVGYIQEPGTYKLVAKAQIDGDWNHLASQNFVMQEAPGNVVTDLTSGQQISGSVSQGDWKQYRITASSSDTELQVDLTNLTADVDLYVRKDS
ncbi:MAG: M23 family metallopeptidase, partial [Candidatus Electrothrix sp. ATG2]|nr:M23 family metallopeptidase [Candidatus Electrothrix sp. ATG2]